MTCNFCGNKIDDSSEFCFICGQKVVKEQPVQDNEQESVFAETQTPVQEVPVETVEPATDAPIEAPVEAPVQAAAPVVEEKVKKTKKVKEKPLVGKFLRFICFISTIISLITYKKATKKSSEERQIIILNLLGKSIVWKLALIVLFMINKYMM